MSRLLQALYFAGPLWLQQAMLAAYGMRLRQLRHGGIHRRVLTELLRSQWASEDELHARQLTGINETIRHARETVPFYRNWPVPRLSRLSELDQFPIVTKADVQRAGEELISRASARWRLLEIHTGGTTGKPLTVYCDRATLRRNYAFFARFRAWAGIPERSRVAVFAGRTIVPPGRTSPPYWRNNPPANALLLSSYHISAATLPHYVKALARFQPALIDSYPSSLEPVARFALDHGITAIRPRAVITSSETLHPAVRRLLEEAFACPAFDHYGAAEMAAFITQCERGTYHVNPEFGVVELVSNGKSVGPGETGEIVATGFINPIMPLIRYATGDLAVRGVLERCACGRAFPIVDRVVGRLDDVVITPEGRRVGRLDPIFKAISGVYETRIVQDQADRVRVEVVTAGGVLPREQRESLGRELAYRLGPLMKIEIVEVSAIPRTTSGKLRTVVNLVYADARSPEPVVVGRTPVEATPSRNGSLTRAR